MRIQAKTNPFQHVAEDAGVDVDEREPIFVQAQQQVPAVDGHVDE